MLASQHIIRSSVHRLPAARQGFVLQQRNSVTVAASSTMPSIGTHSGTFHCDEALGCYLLRLTEQFKDAPVLRSRSPEALKPLDVVIDVGGVYSPGTTLRLRPLPHTLAVKSVQFFVSTVALDTLKPAAATLQQP